MIKIPLLRKHEQPTSLYLIALKKAIKSDGCTDSPDFYVGCGIIHDLGYRYGIDPWGNKVNKRQIDNNFRICMEGQSWLKTWSFIAKVYWAAVKEFGYKAYAEGFDHRKAFETYFWSCSEDESKEG